MMNHQVSGQHNTFKTKFRSFIFGDLGALRCQGDECLEAMSTLLKVPSIALMLPGPLTDDIKHALEKISDSGVLAEI